MTVHLYEALCQACGEAFNPDSPTDLEHTTTEAGRPCGGDGMLLGGYLIGPTDITEVPLAHIEGDDQ